MASIEEEISNAEHFLRKEIGEFRPATGLILGSGLGNLAAEIKKPIRIHYSSVPGFPVSSVEGHAGQLVFGLLCGKRIVAMQGRPHYYEGFTSDEILMPVRLMKRLGITNLIVTNAAGGISKNFKPGSLMLIRDHISFPGFNPLHGSNLDIHSEQFNDRSAAYSPGLIQKAKAVANETRIRVKEGVYFFSSGPSYETPAEIRAMRILGADVVGMSTVPEVMAAIHSGIKVLGISCITNLAAGILKKKLSHDEVIEMALKTNRSFSTLVKGIIKKL